MAKVNSRPYRRGWCDGPIARTTRAARQRWLVQFTQAAGDAGRLEQGTREDPGIGPALVAHDRDRDVLLRQPADDRAKAEQPTGMPERREPVDVLALDAQAVRHARLVRRGTADVADHRIDRLLGQHRAGVERADPADEVGRIGGEAASSGRCRDDGRERHERAAIGQVDGRRVLRGRLEPVAVGAVRAGLLGGLIPGVSQAQRLEEAGADLVRQGRATDPLGEHPEHEVVGVRVVPTGARLEVRLADVLHRVGRIPDPAAIRQQLLVDRGMEEVVAQAAGVVEQLADRDLGIDLHIGQVRPHRLVEVDRPVMGQGQHEGRREGLAHARDGERRGRGHGRLGGDVRQAAHADPRAAIGEEHRDRDPGDAISLAQLVETLLQGAAGRRRRRETGQLRRPDPDGGDDRARRQGRRRDRIRGVRTCRRDARYRPRSEPSVRPAASAARPRSGRGSGTRPAAGRARSR